MSDHDAPHRRYNPLRDSWVLLSPHRDRRPWQGQEESAAVDEPPYRDDCYLCPGNARAGGERNPDYTGVHVFDNDFPALLPESRTLSSDDLLRAAPVQGRCRVICYSPRHDLRMAQMETAQIRTVIDCWADEVARLRREYEHVQVFENRGATMGCSNAHPHGQIWAVDCQPSEIMLEDRQQRAYQGENDTSLLLDYAAREIDRGERVLLHDDHWLVVVPWWASWPFETLLLPLAPVAHLPELGNGQRRSLARTLQQLLGAYDRLFNAPFPYSMGWHGRPTSVRGLHWQLHAHVYPPLLRSASVRKHMVGFEMLGEPQRDLTPERAAARLREVIG